MASKPARRAIRRQKQRKNVRNLFLNHPPIRPNHLPVHPPRVRTQQKRHDARNILRLAQSPKRIEIRQPRDLLLALPFKEQLRRHRPRRHGVHRDRPAAQFLRRVPLACRQCDVSQRPVYRLTGK